MQLVIDKGNTAIKCAVYLNGKSVFEARGAHALTEAKAFSQKNPVKALLFSDVSGELSVAQLSSLFSVEPILAVKDLTRYPFIHKYKTPETLGEDRIALVAAAHKCYPNTPVLVVDAGSCITYDFLDAEGVYHGGAISPGINIRFQSMKTHTGKLPLGSVNDLPEGIGQSTLESLAVGVVKGTVYEIEGHIAELKFHLPDLTVILTGGDAELLSKRLKNPIFAHPNFLLEGLDHLLAFNINK